MTRAKVGVLMIVAMTAWLTYEYRISFENWVWHWRHGNVLTMSGYLVPAPNNWYVIDTGDESWLLTRVDTEDHTGSPARDKKGRLHAFLDIHLSLRASAVPSLAAWVSLETSLLKKQGIDPTFRNFDLNGETLSCVNMQKFSQFAPMTPEFVESDLNTWECMSCGRLELRFAGTDADMPQVWEIVSRIQRIS